MSSAKILHIDFMSSGKSCKLGIKEDPKRSLEGHRLKCFSRKKFVHSIQPFIYDLGNLSIISISHQMFLI